MIRLVYDKVICCYMLIFRLLHEVPSRYISQRLVACSEATEKRCVCFFPFPLITDKIER